MSREQQSTTEQQQFWQMAIETWQSSGLSVRQFCKQEGLSAPSFYSWRKKLLNGNLSPPASNAPEVPAFIEVSLPTTPVPALELVFSSGHVLRIPPGADSHTLSHVLSALHEAHLC